MNVVLVPALLLLLGLVFYKKVWEPRHSGSQPEKKGKDSRAKASKPKASKPKASKPKENKADVKARASVGSGRAGSVL